MVVARQPKSTAEYAEKNWHRLRGFAYLAKVIDRVKFVNCLRQMRKKVEMDEETKKK